MEEAPENGKESLHSAHGNGMNELYRVSQNLCQKLFPGIPHPHLSKNVPINMGPKVNRFRDIDCCVEIREIL
jgi:hypothetical protein